MAKILVIRFSAIGDVAMTVPVIHSWATQYPRHQIVFLSRPSLAPLFSNLPDNVSFFNADLKGRHSGWKGLYVLFKELKALHFDAVLDLHNVLRTKYLSLLFRFIGTPVYVLHKGRWGKRKLIRRRNKKLVSQKNSFQRYADVFTKAGFPVLLNFSSIYGHEKGDFSIIQSVTGEKGNAKWIGIAPFAKHKGKIYPLELQEQVVAHFAQDDRVKVFLFGGGKEEEDCFKTWTDKYPTVTSLIGKLTMDTELALMSHLDVMLSMDSANMHLASLVNIPVVSIWGATHPYAGFMGWKQLPTNTIQITDLYCRPCSVFGQTPCYRGDYACLYGIMPVRVIEKIESIVF
ncbi:glycosyltransferase family 9 protein [uncultured Bacteroides sp.]|uniref:glycosyltransferase family 9 protein n=1 Tax=uncultured Bacteroides sp. TaxID=162156 RepID=UPI002AA6DA0E|nr:glycosyltransferase family 9 protein [uncultured Bacteroides sp.]